MNKIYRFQIEGEQEIISVNKDLLKYLGPLNYLVQYIKANDIDGHIITLENTSLKTPVLKWIIDALIELNLEPEIDNFESLYVLTKHRHPDLSLNLLGRDETLTLHDLSLLAEIITELDWLQAKKLLFLALKQLYTLIDTLSNIALTKQCSKTEHSVGLPFTPYYERELLIHCFLSQLLPVSLIRARYHVQKYIEPIQLGTEHQLFLKADGLYGNGRNDRGQLGFKKSLPTVYHKMVKLVLKGTPLLINCADAHSFCLTSDGLYATGDNKYGQLGITSKTHLSYIDEWRLIPTQGQVLLIQTSEKHSILLTTSGLYGCGFNQRVWTRLPFNHLSIFRIRVASGVTYLLTSNGLYRSSTDGLTGFQLIATIHGLVNDMNCSPFHFLLATNKALYGMGENEQGQLGIEESYSLSKINYYDSLTRVEPLTELTQLIACGRFFTVIETDNGLYATGDNADGQLGLGDEENRTIFTKMNFPIERVYALVAKGNTVLWLTKTGVYKSGYFEGSSYPLPLKLPIEMGYSWTAEDQTEKKRIGLQCEVCSNEARYIKALLPLCSRYCLLQLELQ